MNASKTVLLGCVALAAPVMACYATTYNDCYYYYGYYDPYCGYYYYDTYAESEAYTPVTSTQVAVQSTPNPDPNLPAVSPDAIVAIDHYNYLARDPEAASDAKPDLDGIDEQYPCNESRDGTLALCSADGQEFVQDEDYLVVVFELQNPLPQADTTNFLVVSFAFDTDNDTSNNFTPPAETANDYAGGTDKWYTARYTPADGWILETFAWNGTAIESVPTNARIILEGKSAALLAPASEFATDVPGSRISLFRHTGDEGANGDWSGLVYPPLGAPLAGP
jgi:hypothetical protein